MGLSIISLFALGLTIVNLEVMNASGGSSFFFKTKEKQNVRSLWQTSGSQSLKTYRSNLLLALQRIQYIMTTPQQHGLAARKINSSLGCVNRSMVQGRHYPLLRSTWDNLETLDPHLGPSSAEKTSAIWNELSGGPPNWSEEHLSCEEGLRDRDFFSLENKWLWGGCIRASCLYPAAR